MLASEKFAKLIGEIIDAATEHGGIEEFGTTREQHVMVGEAGAVLMPLSIESMVWAYPDGAVSVTHWYAMNGDTMMDPMVVVTLEGEPVEYQQDGVFGGYERYDIGVVSAKKADLVKFLDTWADNLRHMWLPMAKGEVKYG